MSEEQERVTNSHPNPKPIQFGLRTLLLFTIVVAAAFGLAQWQNLGLAIPFFIVGLGLLMALMTALMTGSQSSMTVAYKTEALDQAILIRNYLRERNIAATIREGDLTGFTGIAVNFNAILVPAHQQAEAKRLITEKLDAAQ